MTGRTSDHRVGASGASTHEAGWICARHSTPPAAAPRPSRQAVALCSVLPGFSTGCRVKTLRICYSFLCYMYGPIFMRMLPASVTRSLLAGLLLMAGGCALLKPAPTPILPPDELYSQG